MTMIRRMHRARAAYLACGAALLWTAGAALAADPGPSNHPQPTKEQREKMAEAHEKIAACLRSDKPIEECHAEMKQMHEAMMHHHEHAGKAQPAPDGTNK
jgi:hypothetical protein